MRLLFTAAEKHVQDSTDAYNGVYERKYSDYGEQCDCVHRLSMSHEVKYMIDYEGVKAMIEARMKQWKEQAERVQKLEAEMPTHGAALNPLITALDASVTACEVILQDLQTAYDIHQAQVR